MKIIFAILLFTISVAVVFAQTVRPSVSIVGEAKTHVSPDQVIFTFEVVTADKDLSTAKRLTAHVRLKPLPQLNPSKSAQRTSRQTA